jgi:hypothetical protein
LFAWPAVTARLPARDGRLRSRPAQADGASEYQRDGEWVISWNDAPGAWREGRTNCANRQAACRLCDDLKRHAERRRLGLEPLLGDRARTALGELMDWFWRRHAVNLRSQSIRFKLEKHLAPLRPLRSPPGPMVTSTWRTCVRG